MIAPYRHEFDTVKKIVTRGGAVCRAFERKSQTLHSARMCIATSDFTHAARGNSKPIDTRSARVALIIERKQRIVPHSSLYCLLLRDVRKKKCFIIFLFLVAISIHFPALTNSTHYSREFDLKIIT